MSKDNLTQTLVKGLNVLECIASSNTYLSAMQVAERCNISRSTAYRLLVTLEDMNYVIRVNESAFKIGPSVYLLGQKELDRDELPVIAKPYLIKLSEKIGETALLTTLIGSEVVSIARIESKKSLKIGSKVGSIYPLYCTAMGKAILAYLDKDRQNELISKIDFIRRTKNTITDKNEFIQHLDRVHSQGYAIDNRESDEDVKCMCAPVFNMKGVVIAAIGFSGVAFRVDNLDQHEIIHYVMQIANDLSKRIGYIPKITDKQNNYY